MVLVIDASRGPASSLSFARRAITDPSGRLRISVRAQPEIPIAESGQIVVRLSDRDRPEPKLLDSMLLEQSQRIGLETFQQSWQAAGNAMEDS
jgi:hypothetical protein